MNQNQNQNIDLNTQVLTNLKLFGYHVIPNFLSQAECERLRKHIDDIMGKQGGHKVQRDFKEGLGGDHRLFGLENTDKVIYDTLYNLPFFDALKSHTQENTLTPCTVMAGFISSSDKSEQTMINSGGSWHRDPGTQYGTRVKTIIYLSDVSKKNGPFTIIPNSRASDVGIGHVREDCARVHQGLRIYDDFVEELRIQGKIPVEVTAQAGTMIIVDVGNIHRGKPIQKGIRYSLTNYFESNPYRSNNFKRNNKHFIDK